MRTDVWWDSFTGLRQNELTRGFYVKWHTHLLQDNQILSHEKSPLMSSCTHAGIHCLRHSCICIFRGGWTKTYELQLSCPWAWGFLNLEYLHWSELMDLRFWVKQKALFVDNIGNVHHNVERSQDWIFEPRWEYFFGVGGFQTASPLGPDNTITCSWIPCM